MLKPEQEELAYRASFERLTATEEADLEAAALENIELAELLRENDLLAGDLALTIRPVVPPAGLKQSILDRLPPLRPGTVSLERPAPSLEILPRPGSSPRPTSATMTEERLADPAVREESASILHVTFWFPYAAAAALMLACLYEFWNINELKVSVAQLNTQLVQARQTPAPAELLLAELKSADASYSDVHVLLAWNAKENHGVVTARNLPPAAAGHDYQLWLLPPHGSPISGGVLTASNRSADFHLEPSDLDQVRQSAEAPGFAISVEPQGGSSSPTGPIVLVASGS